jgi:hypothetical protein
MINQKGKIMKLKKLSQRTWNIIIILLSSIAWAVFPWIFRLEHTAYYVLLSSFCVLSIYNEIVIHRLKYDIVILNAYELILRNNHSKMILKLISETINSDYTPQQKIKLINSLKKIRMTIVYDLEE